jgi:hypothetical protein
MGRGQGKKKPLTGRAHLSVAERERRGREALAGGPLGREFRWAARLGLGWLFLFFFFSFQIPFQTKFKTFLNSKLFQLFKHKF